MTHDQLCVRALRWLRNTKRCNPTFSCNASCPEIPDAIGWSAHGSIVVECKTSILDFYADGEKYIRYTRPGWHSQIRGNGRKRQIKEAGYQKIVIPSMGDYRYFLCEPGIIELSHMDKYPDHGLLHVVGRQVKVILEAKERESPNLRGELRYLRFAIVNGYCCRRRPREAEPSLIEKQADQMESPRP